MQPCMTNWWGGVILQISRLISLARFGQSVPVAGSQALNAEDAVTVAEPRWPPPIQNATAAVVTGGDYANVQRTVGLRLKHPRRLRLKAVTWSEETGSLQKGREKTGLQRCMTVDHGKNAQLINTNETNSSRITEDYRKEMSQFMIIKILYEVKYKEYFRY